MSYTAPYLDQLAIRTTTKSIIKPITMRCNPKPNSASIKDATVNPPTNIASTTNPIINNI